MKTADLVQQPSPGALPQLAAGPENLLCIRHLIAGGSGKGGVGKSAVNVNLALALKRHGARRMGATERLLQE